MVFQVSGLKRSDLDGKKFSFFSTENLQAIKTRNNLSNFMTESFFEKIKFFLRRLFKLRNFETFQKYYIEQIGCKKFESFFCKQFKQKKTWQVFELFYTKKQFAKSSGVI